MPPRIHRRRSGYVLISFALLAVALLAVAALVADLGLAMVARRRMRTATDAAALEGLRLRDDVPPQWRDGSGHLDPGIIAAMRARPADPGEGPPLDPTDRDDLRRWAARQVAAAAADDDPRDPDPDAGPGVDPRRPAEVPGGADADAGDPAPGGAAADRWPLLQLNRKDARTPDLGNLDRGDMVSGNSPATAATHAESTGYARADFARDPAAPGDPAAPPANSFLVRLRRSAAAADPDDLPGVSSAGPALPRLFGRGLLSAPAGEGAGIVARAASIADARPALTVGSPAVRPRIVGVAPFGLSIDLWNRLSPGGPGSPATSASGTIATDPRDRTAGSIGLISTPLGGGQVFGLGTLGAALGVGDDAMTVRSARGFPSPGDCPAPASLARFVVQVDDELIRITGGAGTATWAVERGVGGTIAAPHPIAAGQVPTPVRLVARSHNVRGAPAGGVDPPVEVPDPPAVGQPFVGSPPHGLVVPTVATRFIVPIYRPIADRSAAGRSVPRIIGFGAAYVTTTATPPYDFARGIPVRITQLPSAIAPQNASVRFTPSWDDPSADELEQVLGPGGANARMASPLLAPALVRSE